jgi:hypothetical protein
MGVALPPGQGVSGTSYRLPGEEIRWKPQEQPLRNAGSRAAANGKLSTPSSRSTASHNAQPSSGTATSHPGASGRAGRRRRALHAEPIEASDTAMSNESRRGFTDRSDRRPRSKSSNPLLTLNSAESPAVRGHEKRPTTVAGDRGDDPDRDELRREGSGFEPWLPHVVSWFSNPQRCVLIPQQPRRYRRVP